MKAFIDGDHLCVVGDDFINLQESEAVFIELSSLCGACGEKLKALEGMEKTSIPCEGIICPFCGERGFDTEGLKYHLNRRYCERWLTKNDR